MVASGKVEQNREACRSRVPVFTRGYGCDEPLELPDGTTKIQVEIACPACGGGSDDCGYCVEGRVGFDRCPYHLVQEAQSTMGLLNFFTTSFAPHGHLPGPGGMLDQPAVFVRAMQHLSHVQNELRGKA